MTPLRTHNNRRRRKQGRRTFISRFMRDLYAVWEEQGPASIRKACTDEPLAVALLVERLAPGAIAVAGSTPIGVSDEHLAELKDFAEKMNATKGA